MKLTYKLLEQNLMGNIDIFSKMFGFNFSFSNSLTYFMYIQKKTKINNIISVGDHVFCHYSGLLFVYKTLIFKLRRSFVLKETISVLKETDKH